jgi:hypothetical protein
MTTIIAILNVKYIQYINTYKAEIIVKGFFFFVLILNIFYLGTYIEVAPHIGPSENI